MKFLTIFLLTFSFNSLFAKTQQLSFEIGMSRQALVYDDDKISTEMFRKLQVLNPDCYETYCSLNDKLLVSLDSCIDHPSLKGQKICGMEMVEDPRFVTRLNKDIVSSTKELKEWTSFTASTPIVLRERLKTTVLSYRSNLKIAKILSQFYKSWDFSILKKFEKEMGAATCSKHYDSVKNKKKWEIHSATSDSWNKCILEHSAKAQGKKNITKKADKKTTKEIWNEFLKQYKIKLVVLEEWDT
jgi:hypothetical protein